MIPSRQIFALFYNGELHTLLPEITLDYLDTTGIAEISYSAEANFQPEILFDNNSILAMLNAIEYNTIIMGYKYNRLLTDHKVLLSVSGLKLQDIKLENFGIKNDDAPKLSIVTLKMSFNPQYLNIFFLQRLRRMS